MAWHPYGRQMWKRWGDLQLWSIWTLIAGLGATIVLLAWSSYNLYFLAVANFRFIAAHGTMALVDGGLLQFMEILCFSMLSLALYLAFRGFDTEIIERWREINKK